MATNSTKSPSSGTVRVFVAVEVPEEIRGYLAGLQAAFRRHGRVVKLVDPNLMHLTLRFLGNVPAHQLGSVERTIRDTARDVYPFTLTLSQFGAFPGKGQPPRVVWVGLAADDGYDALQRVFSRLEDRLILAGFPAEARPFAPHVTLARLRDGVSIEEARGVDETVIEARASKGIEAVFLVSQLTLMRSDLGPGGARYTPLAQAPFELGFDGRIDFPQDVVEIAESALNHPVLPKSHGGQSYASLAAATDCGTGVPKKVIMASAR